MSDYGSWPILVPVFVAGMVCGALIHRWWRDRWLRENWIPDRFYRREK
jgi:hypothetical protein